MVWHNLREEPLVFINGNPFVVRTTYNPFANLEYTGTAGCTVSCAALLRVFWHSTAFCSRAATVLGVVEL